MKERLLVILKVTIIFCIALAIIYFSKRVIKNNKETSSTNLVIFGDNIDEKYSPIIQDGQVFLSYDTIETFIDEDIFYDENAKKIIITNSDSVYKFKVGASEATKNLEKYHTGVVVKEFNDSPYIDVAVIKDIYDIKSEYNEETNTILIDKKDIDDVKLNYNNVPLYSDIDTSSDVIEILNKENSVHVYEDSLNHNRWYKVKTDSGKVGYIDKSSVTLENTNNEEEEEITQKDRIISFWQYTSNLDTLGDKIDGVNTVMPMWYELSDGDGSVKLNYNKEYYNKAKNNGYEVWPVITNGTENKKEMTSEVMNDESKREELIRNIVGIIKDNNLDGINIDFESMKEEDKYLYTEFLRELYPMVKQTGAKLSVDVYFTSYMDRKGIGKACDYFILMGYDQRGNWSDEAGSISEISWVEENVKSLINDSNIEPSKIILGIPFYTRLWIIDSNGFTTKVYTMQNSKDFVENNSLTPKLDEESGQNFVETTIDGKINKLWIEDDYSVKERVDIVNKYGLSGIAAWQKGYETSNIWNTINENLN